MQLCAFKWAILAHVALPTGVNFFATIDGRKTALRFETAEGAYLFSYTGEDYFWLAEPKRINFHPILSIPEYNDVVFRRIYAEDDTNLFSGGIADPTKYSLVHLFFEIENEKEINDSIIFRHLREWAAKVYNDFINLYAAVTGDVTISKLNLTELPSVMVWTTNKYSISDTAMEANFSLYSGKAEITWRDPRKIGQIKIEASRDAVNKLAERWRVNYRLKPFEQLLIDAKEQSLFRGNHDLSIVISETAFEIFIQSSLIAASEQKKRTSFPNKRDKKAKDINYKQAIERGNIHTLFWYIELLTKKDVTRFPEYRAWKDDAYQLRNEIIHRGGRGYSENQAEGAFNVVNRFIDAVKQVLS